MGREARVARTQQGLQAGLLLPIGTIFWQLCTQSSSDGLYGKLLSIPDFLLPVGCR